MTRAGSSKEPGCLCPGRGRAERIVRGQGSRASYLQGGLQESNDGLGPHSLWSAADACFVGKQLADVEVNLRPGGKHNHDAGEVLRRLDGQPHYEDASAQACLIAHMLSCPVPREVLGGRGGGRVERGSEVTSRTPCRASLSPPESCRTLGARSTWHLVPESTCCT